MMVMDAIPPVGGRADRDAAALLTGFVMRMTQEARENIEKTGARARYVRGSRGPLVCKTFDALPPKHIEASHTLPR